MKVTQLQSVLHELEKSLLKKGKAHDANAAAEFAKLTAGMEPKTAAAFVKYLQASEIQQATSPIQTGERIRDLAEHLKQIAEFFRAGAANGQANALLSVVDALAPFGDQSVQSYVAAVKGATRNIGGRSRPRRAPDHALVTSYLEEFHNAGDDRAKFETVVAQMKGDARIVGQALTKIVNSVTGHEGPFRNKAAAYDWLVSSFTDQVRFKAKLRPTDA